MQTVDVETGEVTNALALVDPNELQLTGDDLVMLSGAILERGLAQLEQQNDLSELKESRDKTAALNKFFREQLHEHGGRLEATNNVTELRLRQERRLGQVIIEMQKDGTLQKAGGDRKSFSNDSKMIPSYLDFGITGDQAMWWQAFARADDKLFEGYINWRSGDTFELSTFGLYARLTKPHVSKNSGENEWYTPAVLIEAAREVMGCIDLDPASSEIAQQIVQATAYFDKKHNGLTHEWLGNVWLNPPYSEKEIVQFTDKLCAETRLGNVRQACVLVNNATETEWFQSVLEIASMVCLVKGRVKFLDKQLQPTGAPLQGQIVLYVGKAKEAFAQIFSTFGKVLDV